nr:hypothetical protein [Tanacetum cinerariifolium]
ESVGSRAPRVIIFGAIPAISPVILKVPIVLIDHLVSPEVGTVSVVSPVEVLDFVDYSSFSDSDLLEDSLPLVLDLPLVSCSGLSSHDTLAPLSEFPLAPIVAPPGIRQRPANLIRPDEAIPFGQLYRTHSNGPRKSLTARKRVGPIPACRITWRRISHHSSDRHSSPDSSSSRSPSDHSLSGHTPPDTTDADSSKPQRFSSFGSSFERSLDSSSLSSRPSRERYRSHIASVPSPTHDSRSIAPTHAGLLPPCKRFRDSYSPEDSGDEQMEVDTGDVEAVANVGISDEVVAHTGDGVGMRVEITASDVRRMMRSLR